MVQPVMIGAENDVRSLDRINDMNNTAAANQGENQLLPKRSQYATVNQALQEGSKNA